MNRNQSLPSRKSQRLATYDYSLSSGYFITICTHQRQAIFGRIIEDVVHLTEAGRIIEEEWRRSVEIRSEVDLDVLVVMPNHLHGIIFLRGPMLAVSLPREPRGPTPRSVSSFVGGFKAASTRRIRNAMGEAELTVWQRGFHDRVIRNERELEAIREYVADNPRKWSQDPNHVGMAGGRRL